MSPSRGEAAQGNRYTWEEESGLWVGGGVGRGPSSTNAIAQWLLWPEGCVCRAVL
jgi:hypothetical protein